VTDEKVTAIAQIEGTLRRLGLLAFSGEVQLLDWSKSTAREGPKIKFSLQTDEDLSPFELATVAKGKQAGQLYQIFAIRVDAEDQKEAPKRSFSELGPLCKSAIDLCKSERFQEYANSADPNCFYGEDGAKKYLCEMCGISSRTELDYDEKAKDRFANLMKEYRKKVVDDDWRRTQQANERAERKGYGA
jgi:hypothetical protein